VTQRVYLDHAATTPMSEGVLEVYTQALHVVGNPSSIHQAGQEARGLFESARAELAGLLGADPMQLTFTSGATEAINTWLKGRTFALRHAGVDKPVWFLTRAEHHATLDVVSWLERLGLARIEWIDVDSEAVIDLDQLGHRLGEYPAGEIAGFTSLVANNEVGSIQPVEQLAELCRDMSVSLHLDAVQAFGQIPLPSGFYGADALSISAHKIGGPVGVGALVLSRTAPTIEALQHGGTQQEHRSGTLNAAAAVAFAHAASLAVGDVDRQAEHYRRLTHRLRSGLVSQTPGVTARGSSESAPHICHVTIDGVDGDVVLFVLDSQGIDVSTGSACQAGVAEPSHVLLAMGLDEELARGTLRLSVGAQTTDDDIDRILEAFPDAVRTARHAGQSGGSS